MPRLLLISVTGLALFCSACAGDAPSETSTDQSMPRRVIQQAAMPCEPDRVVNVHANGFALDATISNDGRFIAARPDFAPESVMYLYDLETEMRTAIQYIPRNELERSLVVRPKEIRFSADGRFVVINYARYLGSMASRLVVIDTETMEFDIIGEGVQFFRAPEFSPDGTHLIYASGTNDHIFNSDPTLPKRSTGAFSIFLHDLATGEVQPVIAERISSDRLECLAAPAIVPLAWGFIRQIVMLDSGNIAVMVGNPFDRFCGPNGHLFAGQPRIDNRSSYEGWIELQTADGPLPQGVPIEIGSTRPIGEETGIHDISSSGRLLVGRAGPDQLVDVPAAYLRENSEWSSFRGVITGMISSNNYAFIGGFRIDDPTAFLLLPWNEGRGDGSVRRTEEIDLGAFSDAPVPVCIG